MKTYWVKVTFKNGMNEYTYMCDIPGVREGDKLLVNGGYSGMSQVTCTHVGHSAIPKVASKFILDKYDNNGELLGYSEATPRNKYGKPVNKGVKKVNKSFSDRMMNRFFRKVDGVKWDLMSGRVGVVLNDEIVTLDGEGEDARIEINIMEEFGMAIPAFAQNTAADSVTVGDLIYQGSKVKGWVTEVKKSEGKPTKFGIMTPTGTATNWNPPKVSMFGVDSGIMVLKSLLTMLPKGADGESGLGGMQNILLPMMMMGGGDSEIENMMPLMLMSQLGTDGTGNNAFGGGNMIQMMMMMKMMGGKGGNSSSGFGYFDN